MSSSPTPQFPRKRAVNGPRAVATVKLHDRLSGSVVRCPIFKQPHYYGPDSMHGPSPCRREWDFSAWMPRGGEVASPRQTRTDGPLGAEWSEVARIWVARLYPDLIYDDADNGGYDLVDAAGACGESWSPFYDILHAVENATPSLDLDQILVIEQVDVHPRISGQAFAHRLAQIALDKIRKPDSGAMLLLHACATPPRYDPNMGGKNFADLPVESWRAAQKQLVREYTRWGLVPSAVSAAKSDPYPEERAFWMLYGEFEHILAERPQPLEPLDFFELPDTLEIDLWAALERGGHAVGAE